MGCNTEHEACNLTMVAHKTKRKEHCAKTCGLQIYREP